ncbi:GDSL-type esterase/lipase family protein [Palleronia sp.]|uniref:GDSL-type esterase/lipase family protein n=1 Tax=Palleronia sp. TaxID=1940284 RepID=UPI0035C83148
MPHVLIFGDSNTHGSQPDGADVDRLSPEDRWAGHVARELGADWRLTVDGLPGRTCVLDDPIEGAWKNGSRVLPASLQTHAPLDGVAIMLGTNDQKARFALSGLEIAYGLRPLLHMVDRLAPGARILVVCPPAVQETGLSTPIFRGATDRCADLPAHMAEIAAVEGAGFFDANTVISTDAEEGVHFGPEAHAALGRALAPAFRKQFT